MCGRAAAVAVAAHLRRRVRLHSLPGGRPPAIVEVVAPPPVPPPDRRRSPPTPPAEIRPGRRSISIWTEAQAAMAKGDYAAAREQCGRVLELDPGNQEALDLKRQAEIAAAARRGEAPCRRRQHRAPPVAKSKRRGFPDGPAKRGRTTLTRVQRIEANLKEGRRCLDKQDFALRARPLSTGRAGPEGLSRCRGAHHRHAGQAARGVRRGDRRRQKNEQAGKTARRPAVVSAARRTSIRTPPLPARRMCC